MRKGLFPWLGGAGLATCAVLVTLAARHGTTSYPGYLLVGVMLFYPLLDPHWRPPALSKTPRHIVAWMVLLFAGVALIAHKPDYLEACISTFFTAALPEEWFFRAYFMSALGPGLSANVAASLLFSLLHGVTRGWMIAPLVLLPSLFYGWLYQRTRDLPLLVLVHAVSNIVFLMFLADSINRWLPR